MPALSFRRAQYALLLIVVLAWMLSTGCGGAVSAGSSPSDSTKPSSPAAAFSSATLDFGDQTLNVSSAARSIRLYNNGNASLSISGITAAGDYLQTNDCGASLAAGANCTISVRFRPTAVGSRSATLSVADNAAGSPHQVALNGNGVATTPGQLSISPSTVPFGNVVLEHTGTRTLTLSNTGGTDVTISNVTTDGPGFAMQGVSTPLTLVPGQEVTATVTFTPSNAGDATGTVSFANDGALGNVTVNLSGTGVQSGTHSVDLSWNASTSANVVGYNVYKGTQAGGPYAKITTAPVGNTSYTDLEVSAGATYSYVVTAVDGSEAESAYSNEAMALVPAP